MKKVISILICMLCIQVFASDFYCHNDTPSKNAAGIIASASGFNMAARNIAQHQISNALKKQTGAKFDIKIKSWWGANILNGEFQDFSAKTKQYAYKKIYLSDLEINSLCSYNKIEYKDKTAKFKYDTPLKFSAAITQNDLNNMLKIKNTVFLIQNHKIKVNY